MRFVETDGRPGTVNVSSTIVNVEKGWLCNSVEENQEPLTVSPHGFSFSVKPFGIVTVRLEGTPRLEQTRHPTGEIDNQAPLIGMFRSDT